jgi:acyl-CoA thioesterase II
MDSCSFLGLQQSHNRFRWHLAVVPTLSTGGNFLFGGCGLAAGILSMEGTSGRQCIWASAQYLSFARPGEVLDVDVTLATEGHQMTQARAVCHVGNREVLTVNAALGERPLDARGQWEQMPVVPPPSEGRRRPHRLPIEGTIAECLDEQLVGGRDVDQLDGTPGDGTTHMWVRLAGVEETIDAAFLAILGDFVPFGVSQALGIAGGGTSLDNTLRVGHLVPTEWVLLEVRVHAVDRGFGHGLVHMFAEDGTLLATASQSCIVRFTKPPPNSQKEPR